MPWPAPTYLAAPQVVEMLRKGQGVFTLVVISGQQVQTALVHQTQVPGPASSEPSQQPGGGRY